jgi:hypothetical protein
MTWIYDWDRNYEKKDIKPQCEHRELNPDIRLCVLNATHNEPVCYLLHHIRIVVTGGRVGLVTVIIGCSKFGWGELRDVQRVIRTGMRLNMWLRPKLWKRKYEMDRVRTQGLEPWSRAELLQSIHNEPACYPLHYVRVVVTGRWDSLGWQVCIKTILIGMGSRKYILGWLWIRDWDRAVKSTVIRMECEHRGSNPDLRLMEVALSHNEPVCWPLHYVRIVGTASWDSIG